MTGSTSAMPPQADRTPLYVLTGFLGSGKTTLLNTLLRTTAFADTAVIVNEFGEIGLDHHLIASATDNVVLLESGCLCCTLVDSLEETLADLYRRRAAGEVKAFRRVLIETSGLADPGPILNVLLGHRLVTDVYRLGALVCTVDAQQVARQLERHDEARRQIALSDRLLFTKTDLVSRQEALRIQDLCVGINPLVTRAIVALGVPPVAAFTHTDLPRVRPAFVLPAGHSAGVRAHCFTLDHTVTWAGIAAWTRLLSEAFGDDLLRTKALLRLADTPGAVFIQGVGRLFHRPERLASWPDDDRRGRIVCIVQNVAIEPLRRSLVALALEAGIDAHLRLDDLSAGPTIPHPHR